MNADIDSALAAITEARRALDQAEAALMGGASAKAAALVWPPRPEDIDLGDDIWLTPQQAASAVNADIDTVYGWLAGPTGADFAIKIRGRWRIHRGRLMRPS